MKNSQMKNLTLRSVLQLAVVSILFCGFSATQVSAAEFTEEEMCYLTAEELIPLFQSGKLSPVDVLKAQISRYEEVGKKTNSVTYTHFDTAMEQALESEKRYANGTARALEGITVGVKDEHHDAGWTVTRGSNLLKDNVMDHADPIVTKLKEAGAILSLQTTVPEFYMTGVTWSKLWGVSRNPWNLNYSVGGSSGGSGAALAAGLTTLATGSDMGGSIRLPSAYNGLYGFKPSHGRVTSSETLSYFATTGPMARSFDDMVRLMNVMTGQVSGQVASLPKLVMPHKYEAITGMRIAYVGSMGLAHLDKETHAGMARAIERLERLGAEVDEINVELEWTEIVSKFIGGVMAGSMGAGLALNVDHVDEMTTYAAYFAEKAASGKYGNTQRMEFEGLVNSLYEKISKQVFDQGYDAIVMPTLATAHVPADYDQTVEGFELEGQEMHKSFILALTVPWNVLNWCPVVNVPTELTAQGMPMGMQIVGKPYADLSVFRIASAYSKAVPRLYSEDRMPDFRR